MKRMQAVVFAVCYASYVSIYIVRLSLTMASPELKATGILSAAQLGMVASVFSVVYAVGRLLTGSLGDKIRPFVFISCGLAMAGISNILVGFLPPFTSILVLWALNAFAQSMLWGSVLCAISAVYPEEVARRRNATMVTSVATGNILGILAGMYIINTLSLRWAFIIPGIVTLFFCIIAFATLRRLPAASSQVAKPRMNMKELLSHSEIRKVALPAMFHGAIRDNITLWMILFFVDRFAVRLDQSAYYVLVIPVVGLLGRLSYPVLYRMSEGRELEVSRWAFAVCVGASVILSVNQRSPFVSAVCLGLSYAAVSVANTSFLSIYPTRFSAHGNIASVSGLMDFCTYLGAGLSSILYGILIDRFGYGFMFLSWSLLSVISIGLLGSVMKKKFIQ